MTNIRYKSSHRLENHLRPEVYLRVLVSTGVLQSHEPTLSAAKAALDAVLASQLQPNDVINSDDPDSASTSETTPLSAAVSY